MNLISIVGCCVAGRLAICALASIGRVQYTYTVIDHHFRMCGANVTGSHPMPFTGVGNKSFYIKVHSEETTANSESLSKLEIGFLRASTSVSHVLGLMRVC